MSEELLVSSGDSSRSPGSLGTHDDVVSISSATSTSSHRSSSHNGAALNDKAEKHREAHAFLSDLNNYLPLGCLCFEDLAQTQEHRLTGAWEDITDLSVTLAFEETLSSHLHRLATAGWIRIFSARSTADPRYIVLRIYILPSDVGLRFIDRHSKRLYVALEGLVAEVDVSPDTWKGNYVPGHACKFDMWAMNDDGSLFWMFNKLSSPSPTVDKIEEKYAHEALEDLLDPGSVLPGLKTQLYPYQRRSAGTDASERIHLNLGAGSSTRT